VGCSLRIKRFCLLKHKTDKVWRVRLVRDGKMKDPKLKDKFGSPYCKWEGLLLHIVSLKNRRQNKVYIETHC
jgi:hypothetical protein